MKNTLKRLLQGAAARSVALRKLALFVAREGGAPSDLWEATLCAYENGNKVNEWSDRVMASVPAAAYERHKALFVKNGSGTAYSPEIRRSLLEQFEAVDAHVTKGTSKTDGVIMAEAVLSMTAEGDMVECGCYQGASTCKLSLVAKATGRRLYVFDSFEGLPEVDEYNLRDFHARQGQEWVTDWTAGRYAGQIDLVKANVQQYGCLDVCTFVKGWFSEELFAEKLPARVSFAFVDADIPSSVRTCIRGLWPRLADLGAFFSHDIAYLKVLQELHDREMWTHIFRAYPPIIYGAGFGFGEHSPHLGFMVKGDAVTPEYINSLTMSK